MKTETFKLRLVREVSFRANELTNYREARRALGRGLGSGEVVAFVSKTGDQILFILGRRRIGKGEIVIDSRRWRLESGRTWNPMMLQNYANDVGIHLEGLPRFEEFIGVVEKAWKNAVKDATAAGGAK